MKQHPVVGWGGVGWEEIVMGWEGLQRGGGEYLGVWLEKKLHVLLGKDSRFAPWLRILVEASHRDTGHCNPQSTLAVTMGSHQG